MARTRPSWKPYGWILGAFAVSRILYYLAGVRFQTEIIHSNFQFIDVDLLKHRLIQTLFYYHMQPPLHNLLVGVAVKLFPASYGTALHWVFIFAGALSAVFLYRLMECLGVQTWLATTLTILFITSPGCVLFENFPMYEYLIMVLLLAQCVALYALLERPGFGTAFLFFSLLGALALLRSFFHLYYVLAVVAALACYLRAHARTILAAAALPVAVVFAWYLKNLVLFGLFVSSSWLGNNLATVTTHQLTPQECTSLVRSGKLIPIGCAEGSAPIDTYRPYLPPLQKTGIPILDQETKSTGGNNFNNIAYLKTGPMYTQAAKQVLRYYPIAYVRSVLIAWFCYFRPPTDFFQFEANRAAIQPFERIYNLVFFGQLRVASGTGLRELKSQGGTASLPLYTGLFLIAGVPLILLATGFYWVRDYRRKSEPPARLALVMFICVQIVVVMLIANFLSSFENNRYRFPTDPLYIALAGALLAKVVRRSSPAA